MSPGVRIRWADGQETSAPTWEALTEVVAALPWNEWIEDIHNELARRAYVWSGAIVNPALPDPEFWRELERAGLVAIVRQGRLDDLAGGCAADGPQAER